MTPNADGHTARPAICACMQRPDGLPMACMNRSGRFRQRCALHLRCEVLSGGLTVCKGIRIVCGAFLSCRGWGEGVLDMTLILRKRGDRRRIRGRRVFGSCGAVSKRGERGVHRLIAILLLSRTADIPWCYRGTSPSSCTCKRTPSTTAQTPGVRSSVRGVYMCMCVCVWACLLG